MRPFARGSSMKPESVPVPLQQLHAVSPPIDEHEEYSVQRPLVERGAHDRGEAIVRLAEVAWGGLAGTASSVDNVEEQPGTSPFLENPRRPREGATPRGLVHVPASPKVAR